MAFAFANAVLFAAYIVSRRPRRQAAGLGIDGLAAAMVLAAVFVTPVGATPVDAIGDPCAGAASASGSARR